MTLAELTEDKLYSLVIDEVMELIGNVSVETIISETAQIAVCKILKMTAIDLCYHCKNVGKPRRVREQFRHFHTAEYSQECKASVIWQAPILDSVQEGEK